MVAAGFSTYEGCGVDATAGQEPKVRLVAQARVEALEQQAAACTKGHPVTVTYVTDLTLRPRRKVIYRINGLLVCVLLVFGMSNQLGGIMLISNESSTFLLNKLLRLVAVFQVDDMLIRTGFRLLFQALYGRIAL
jgi:hypothetical protein